MINLIHKFFATLWFYLGFFLASTPLIFVASISIEFNRWTKSDFEADRVKDRFQKMLIRWLLSWMQFAGIWKINYIGRLPPSGKFIVAPNNDSLISEILALKICQEPSYFHSYSDLPCLPTYLEDYEEFAYKSKLNLAKKKLEEGYSVLVEPRNCRTLTFDTDALALSQESNVPILPIIVRGAFDIFSSGIVDFGEIDVSYCQLVQPEKDKTVLEKNFRQSLLEGFRPIYDSA